MSNIINRSTIIKLISVFFPLNNQSSIPRLLMELQPPLLPAVLPPSSVYHHHHPLPLGGEVRSLVVGGGG